MVSEQADLQRSSHKNTGPESFPSRAQNMADVDAAGQVYGSGTPKLSQLSDIVHLSQEGEDRELPSLPLGLDVSLRASQPGLLEQELPSQPLLPTPELPLSAQRLDTSGAEPRHLSRFAEKNERQSNAQGTERASPVQSMERSTLEVRADKSSRSRTSRRGPMDSMRQLVRILVKIIPHSVKNVKSCEDGGGGNRISEDEIKLYLKHTLGEAPHPKWGVPDGWGGFLAELFTWVTGRPVTTEQAMKCAKREPGRSWEAIDSELAKLGILPSTWPLPLNKRSMGSALVPATQAQSDPATAIAQPASPKRHADADLFEAAAGKRKKLDFADGISGADLARMDEAELWQQALHYVNSALAKAGSSDSLEKQMAVAKARAEIQSKVQVPSIVPQPATLPLLLSQAPSLVPVDLTGPGGQTHTAFTLQLQPSMNNLAMPASADLESLELGSGALTLSQILLSQPNSAVQAVKYGSPLKDGTQNGPASQLLDDPPPLRLSPKPSAQPVDSGPSPPSTDDEDHSSVFNANSLASPLSAAVSKLVKPTALKTNASLGGNPSGSQSETRSGATGSDAQLPQMEGLLPPILGFYANNQFVPLTSASMSQSGLLLPAASAQPVFVGQPATLSQNLETARIQQQQQRGPSSWVPNLNASLQ